MATKTSGPYDDQKNVNDAFDEIVKGYYDEQGLQAYTDDNGHKIDKVAEPEKWAAAERQAQIDNGVREGESSWQKWANEDPSLKKSLGEAEAGAAADSRLGRGYTGGGKDDDDNGLFSYFRKGLKGTSLKQKWAIFGSIGGILTVLGGLGLGGTNFLNVFQLDHLMSNIEAKGFLRFQVDMEGRSRKWISTYLALRLGEVEDPSLKPADRDNIIFRANKVGGNLKLATWYKLMRGSTFEADMLEKDGIKFGSIAYKEGGVIKFRPAVITIKGDAPVKFDITAAERKAIENGDINGFNNRLRQFVDVQVMGNDKEARKAIKAAVKSNTKWYQVFKRYYLRKSIQNMTGVRDWRLFENKTVKNADGTTTETARRDLRQERIAKIRNKIITKAFPESTKSGKFIQCIFGITECKNTTDPSDPENKSALQPPSAESCKDSANPECDTGKVDDKGNPIKNDGSVADGVADGAKEAENLTGSLTKKFLTKILDKINVATGIVSFIDTLNTINNNMKDGTLTALVYMGRATQAIGVYTAMNIMRDQMREGELSGQEADDAMSVVADSAGNSEGWRTVVAPGDTAILSAAGTDFAPAKDKTEYCSQKHQEAMILPQNQEKAKKEYQYLCPSEKIGGDSLAKDIEDGWNNSIGVIISPILNIYESSGLSTVVGWFNSAVDAVLGPIIQAATEGILNGLGLADDFQNLMGWIMSKVAMILGAGPSMSEQAPPGVWANHALMGASASSEFAMRFAGAPETTPESKSQTNARVLAYQQEEAANASLADKYWSLTSTNSVASRGLFALLDQGIGNTLTSSLASIFNLPASILSGQRAHAAAATADGYAAANFGGIQTYDMPDVCMTMDPLTATPQSVTNADELGLIPGNDLTWELVNDSDAFYGYLYSHNTDADQKEIFKKVYNCALFDDMVRGSLGGLYNKDTLGTNAYGYGYTADSTATGNVGAIPTGTTQDLAQKILDSPNLSFQTPAKEKYFDYIAKTGHAGSPGATTTCGEVPVSPVLLGVILALSEKYKLTLGVFVDDHECNGGFHPKGMAVDINGINPIKGGGSGTGDRIEWTAAEQPIVLQFYNDAGPILSSTGGGGLGQWSCFTAVAKPTKAANVAYFDDTCNHVHMDIGHR